MSEKQYVAAEKSPYGQYTGRNRVGAIGEIQEWMEGESIVFSDVYFYELGEEVEVILTVEAEQ